MEQGQSSALRLIITLMTPLRSLSGISIDRGGVRVKGDAAKSTDQQVAVW